MYDRNVTSKETTENPKPNTNRLYRRIGSTTYEVSVNFSKISKENINDKIFRLISNEADIKRTAK